VTEGRRYFRPHLAFSAAWRNRAPGERREATSERAGAEAFREAMLPHMDAAYNFARYLSRDPSAAEDIVQNAFLHAFRSFAGFRGDAPKAWLFAIVRNCFLDWLKSNRNAQAPIEDGAGPWSASGNEAHNFRAIDEETPEAILARSRDAEMVRSTVEGLPEPFRETIVLRELDELSYKEIAMITGVPIGTVMSRLARGRQMLCELLVPDETRGRTARP
jgi:RNA polymerase sigma factor (sigma-70 family)